MIYSAEDKSVWLSLASDDEDQYNVETIFYGKTVSNVRTVQYLLKVISSLFMKYMIWSVILFTNLTPW